jgi:actin related protein 2/3 complex subunit 2
VKGFEAKKKEMILLEYHNKIIEDTLLEKWNTEGGKFETIEAVVADFDGVTFHLSTPDANAKNLLNISCSVKCFAELQKYGVDDVLKKHYGNNLVAPEQGYDVTLQLDLAQPPADRAKFARDVALLKRHILAAPYYKIFNDIEGKKAGTMAEIRYRDDESVFIKSEGDRAIIIFSIHFKDADDVVFAKVFLQEYSDARRTMSNAPAVSYSQKEPPLELKGVRNLKVGESQGYVSFVLFPPHLVPNRREGTIDNIQTFRNYLHYHIKASKAYMHTRFRNRVSSLLQVLNRAKTEPLVVEKRTISGRTFKRD